MSDDSVNDILKDALRYTLTLGGLAATYAIFFVVPDLLSSWKKRVADNTEHNQKMNEVQLQLEQEKLRLEKAKLN